MEGGVLFAPAYLFLMFPWTEMLSPAVCLSLIVKKKKATSAVR